MKAPFNAFIKSILSSGGDDARRLREAIMDSRSKGVQYVQVGNKKYKLEKVSI